MNFFSFFELLNPFYWWKQLFPPPPEPAPEVELEDPQDFDQDDEDME